MGAPTDDGCTVVGVPMCERKLNFCMNFFIFFLFPLSPFPFSLFFGAGPVSVSLRAARAGGVPRGIGPAFGGGRGGPACGGGAGGSLVIFAGGVFVLLSFCG